MLEIGDDRYFILERFDYQVTNIAIKQQPCELMQPPITVTIVIIIP